MSLKPGPQPHNQIPLTFEDAIRRALSLPPQPCRCTADVRGLLAGLLSYTERNPAAGRGTVTNLTAALAADLEEGQHDEAS